MNDKTFFSIFALVASMLVAGCGTDFKSFDALTLTQNGSFELDMNPDKAIPLFTALGEKLWIRHWTQSFLTVTSNGKGGSVVDVTYQLTGLSESGKEGVREMLDKAQYAEVIDFQRAQFN